VGCAIFPAMTSATLDSTDEHAIVESVGRLCAEFTDDYWLDHDTSGVFPHEFYSAMAEGGWLGITMPESCGGAAMGVTEAAFMMHTVAKSGGGFSAASAIHINLFGPHPIVVFGTLEQQQRWLTPLIRGEQQACFAVTEPDAGLNTTAIETRAVREEGGYRVNGRKMWTTTAQVAHKIILLARTTPLEQCAKPSDGMSLFYTDLDRDKIEVRLIEKMGRKAVDSNAVFIDDLFIPEADRIGEEGKGFHYLLHSLNPERILIGVEAVGLGQDALRRASNYAAERVVFNRPIGQNQGIQHPLAENWIYLESAYNMCMKAAQMYDSGQECGAQANASKFLGARAGHDACNQAVLTLGGMGYAKEFHVERLLREIMIARIAPVTEQLILSYIAEKQLNLPKSY
jgi:acyl-CoA dehydrogenase